MKKILLLAALGIGYYAYTQKTHDVSGQTPPINPDFDHDDDTMNPTPPIHNGPVLPPHFTESSPISDKLKMLLQLHKNQIITDSDGYWMLVREGKLYSPLGQQSLIDWQKANPTKPAVMRVEFPVWKPLSDSGLDVFGGSF